VRRGGTLAVMAFLLAACATAPGDSFTAAQAAMRRNDLLAALLAYDAVPLGDTHYPEACAGAAAVQLRLQRGHELMRTGLELRGERRDDEALQCLRQARDVYRDLPGIDRLIASTQERLRRGGGRAPAAAVAPLPGPQRAIPVAELPASEPVVRMSAPVVAAAGPMSTTTAIGLVDPVDESVVLGLVAVETRLGRGELEQAVVDLLELARRFPTEVRVQLRLARVLHQRALLRYGQGALTAASLDWERVLAIEPDNAEVAELLRQVRAEAATPAAPR
jgi:tetratricopeptide (TPR) repeat protein